MTGTRAVLILAVSAVLPLMPALAADPPRTGPYTVVFVIDLRAAIASGRFDPARDTAGVRGSLVPLTWEATLPAVDPDGDGRYVAAAIFARAPFGGQAVAYKFKLDGPRYRDHSAGWEEGRNRQLFLREPSQTVERSFDAPPEPIALSRVGTIERHPAFPSRHLPPRDVQVYLPPGYEKEPARRYPVLYLHDGQHAFDGAEAGMEWQVDEQAEALIRAGRIEPVIVVAVANTEDRTDEYGPTAIERKRADGTVWKGGGKAPLYGRFLVEELKPFVDRTYRTRPEAAATAVGGASLGGLVSLWLGLEYPRVFGAALVVSPAIEWDERLIVRKVAALPKKPPLRVWLDMGTLEGDQAIPAVRALRDALEQKGWKTGSGPAADLAYLEQEGGQHDEISWASRVEGMLLFLYGRTGPR